MKKLSRMLAASASAAVNIPGCNSIAGSLKDSQKAGVAHQDAAQKK